MSTLRCPFRSCDVPGLTLRSLGLPRPLSERFIIAAGAARASRVCFEQAFNWALTRETFGKALVEHQIIRYKLAEMARQIEALQAMVEHVAFLFSSGVPDFKLGGECALLKVNASRTFELCSREASQIFGGASIVKEGKGKLVERMAREVRASAIPYVPRVLCVRCVRVSTPAPLLTPVCQRRVGGDPP